MRLESMLLKNVGDWGRVRRWIRHNPTPYVERLVGRNEPCPCGSGKKYKRCCMRAVAEAYQAQQEKLRTREGKRS
jgi:uncharacterized protein YchJ